MSFNNTQQTPLNHYNTLQPKLQWHKCEQWFDIELFAVISSRISILRRKSYASQRASAGISMKGRSAEAMQGIDYLRWQQKAARSMERNGSVLCGALSQLLGRLRY